MTEQYPQIRPAETEDDIGVVVSFDCEAPELEETFITPAGTKACTINPLNWRTDAVPADRSENPGSCFTDYSGGVINEEAGLCGCYIDMDRGILKVTDLDSANYPAFVPGLPEGAYHIYDYQFFFRALQRNVQLRTEKYGDRDDHQLRGRRGRGGGESLRGLRAAEGRSGGERRYLPRA